MAYGETITGALGFIRGKLSTNNWVSSQIARILKSVFGSAAPKGSMQYRTIGRLKNNLNSLLLSQPFGGIIQRLSFSDDILALISEYSIVTSVSFLSLSYYELSS